VGNEVFSREVAVSEEIEVPVEKAQETIMEEATHFSRVTWINISKDAEEKEGISRSHFLVHSTFAKAVTFFQIAIAVSAISVLIRRRRFWFLSLGFAAFGLFFFVEGFLGSFGGFH
jgi:lipopolysaccharide export LptBFGC system permease protein LptF